MIIVNWRRTVSIQRQLRLKLPLPQPRLRRAPPRRRRVLPALVHVVVASQVVILVADLDHVHPDRLPRLLVPRVAEVLHADAARLVPPRHVRRDDDVGPLGLAPRRRGAGRRGAGGAVDRLLIVGVVLRLAELDPALCLLVVQET
jgi:hypothetical protein